MSFSTCFNIKFEILQHIRFLSNSIVYICNYSKYFILLPEGKVKVVFFSSSNYHYCLIAIISLGGEITGAKDINGLSHSHTLNHVRI